MLGDHADAALLRSTDAPIALLATREVGCGNADFASRQFRRSVGIAPGKHRAMSQAGAVGATGR